MSPNEGRGLSLPQALLGEVSHGDSHQLRVVFNSIDRNQDGFLSLTELQEFTKELRYGMWKVRGCFHGNQTLPSPTSVLSSEDEVKQLLQTMDIGETGGTLVRDIEGTVRGGEI